MFTSKDKWRAQTHANLEEHGDREITSVNNIPIFTFLCAVRSFPLSLLRFLGLDWQDEHAQPLSSLTAPLLFLFVCPACSLGIFVVFAPHRGHALSQVGPICASAMKSPQPSPLTPRLSPLPNTSQIINMSPAATSFMCSCAAACLHSSCISPYASPMFCRTKHHSELCVRI